MTSKAGRETTRKRADFSALRDAFRVLQEIYALRGFAEPDHGHVKIYGIPRQHFPRILAQARKCEEHLRDLVHGTGQRASVSGRQEVVISVLAQGDRAHRRFDICALLVRGRGPIERSLSVSSNDVSWREALRDFVDWNEIDGVISAAEGNNQRAMVGLVLQLAGIGYGKLKMIEAEVPQEEDEAAHMVRGADWLKAGLPRFETAAGEAIWYLMRIRSVHSRMVRVRKQGYYTSMALAALRACGVPTERICKLTGMSEMLVESLTPRPGRAVPASVDFAVLGDGFAMLSDQPDERAAHCAERVWKGAVLFARVLSWRIRIGAEARRRLALGDDLVSISEDLRIQRRDLVRILSVRQDAALAERVKFISAIIDPSLLQEVVSRTV